MAARAAEVTDAGTSAAHPEAVAAEVTVAMAGRAVVVVDHAGMVLEVDRAAHAAMALVVDPADLAVTVPEEAPDGMVQADRAAMTGVRGAMTVAVAISGDGGMTAGHAKPCRRA